MMGACEIRLRVWLSAIDRLNLLDNASVGRSDERIYANFGRILNMLLRHFTYVKCLFLLLWNLFINIFLKGIYKYAAARYHEQLTEIY
jgi:hypothetical protein